MKIRLAIIDEDESYVKRLLNNLQMNYVDKIESYYFTTFDKFAMFVEDNVIHVALVNEKETIENQKILENVSCAYLVSNKNIEELKGLPAVCKFQKTELLYKNVLSLFADTQSNFVLKEMSGGNKCILFVSAQGGAGTSAVASAFSINKAKQGKGVLYLNLDKFHRSQICFKGEGTMSFSDVVYAVKSKRGNLSVKLESAIKEDAMGVHFFDACKNANDMLEFDADDIEHLMKNLGTMENYQYIAIDMPLDFTPTCKRLIESYSQEVIIINDGSEVGNIKFERAMEILKRMEEKKKGSIFLKTKLLYNRFSSSTSKKLVELPIETIGGVNRIEGANYKQLVEKLSTHPVIVQMD